MTAIDSYDITICSDCAIWHANADDTGFCDCDVECTSDQHHAIRNAAAQRRMPLVRASAIVPGDDLGFSSSRCDGCGTNLGGDRFAATLITHS